jgi:hypothetical protein
MSLHVCTQYSTAVKKKGRLQHSFFYLLKAEIHNLRSPAKLGKMLDGTMASEKRNCDMLLPHEFLPWWLWRLASRSLMCHRDLDFLEVFCGEGNLCKAFVDRGFQAIGMDREHGPEQDLGNVTGLEYLVHSVMRLKAGGLLWLAPPCKNWIFFPARSIKGNSQMVS